jgi:tryptophan synthase alpha chain
VSRIADAFARARRENRAAFVAYLTAGDPTPDATVELACALVEAGTDVLELGVPFSDPIADGPVIQRAGSRALANGTTLGTVFEIARGIRDSTPLPMVLFSYVNPLLRRGLSRAAGDAFAAGFDAVLLTDVPPEEAHSVRDPFAASELDTIFLVSPTSPAARMQEAARLSTGFLYVVSRPGTTGARTALARELPVTVRRARKAAGSLPIAIGFGISTPETARRAASLADGVVVGSALVRAAEEAGARRIEAVRGLAQSLSAACRHGHAGRPR